MDVIDLSSSLYHSSTGEKPTASQTELPSNGQSEQEWSWSGWPTQALHLAAGRWRADGKETAGQELRTGGALWGLGSSHNPSSWGHLDVCTTDRAAPVRTKTSAARFAPVHQAPVRAPPSLLPYKRLERRLGIRLCSVCDTALPLDGGMNE